MTNTPPPPGQTAATVLNGDQRARVEALHVAREVLKNVKGLAQVQAPDVTELQAVAHYILTGLHTWHPRPAAVVIDELRARNLPLGTGVAHDWDQGYMAALDDFTAAITPVTSMSGDQ